MRFDANLRRDTQAVGFLVCMWLVVMGAVGPSGDFALNDDWAYAWSARQFLNTGQIRILDWVAPVLVSHVAWGAMLLGLFGNSYEVLRAGSLWCGLVGILAIYALGRCSAFDRRRALVLATAVALSPWYVNLAFTFMTDIPWCCAYFCALTVLLWGTPGRVGPLLAASGCIAVAVLSRQYALVTLPPIAVWAVWDAHRQAKLPWGAALWRGVWALAPAAAAAVLSQYWYTHTHGATVANRATWARMHVPIKDQLHHLLIFWHYFSWWLIPWVAAILVARRSKQFTSVKQCLLAITCLGGYTFYAARSFSAPRLGLDSEQPWMPYLSNIAFNLGLGPLTFFDSYMGITPRLHQVAWLDFGLSGLTVIAGCFTGGFIISTARSTLGLLFTEVRLARHTAKTKRKFKPPDESHETTARHRARVLLVGVTASYLALHLMTGQLIFDRYLLPAMPTLVWLTLDILPAKLATAKTVILAIGFTAVFSIGGTREYLAWNRARAAAVADLLAQGVPAAAIDAGFEYNGAWRFEKFFAQTGSLFDAFPHTFWSRGTRYKLAFWPVNACRTQARYPFWSWPGGDERAIYVMDCGG